MTLHEINQQLKDAGETEVRDLAVEFDRTLQELCYVHDDYKRFNEQYRADINDLKSSKAPENGNELFWYVEPVIEIGEKLNHGKSTVNDR